MDIKNLLCSQQSIYSESEGKLSLIHQRQPSWSSSCSSPSSPNSSSSSFYSVPSSPEISSPTSIILTKSSPSQTRTPWTSEEDQLLQQGYSRGLSWAMISTVYLPHRSRGCCWGRFKTLQAKSLEQREWSDSEDRLLMLAIKKNSRLFKQAWKSVAQEMGSRGWKECELRSLHIGSNNGVVKKKA